MIRRIGEKSGEIRLLPRRTGTNLSMRVLRNSGEIQVSMILG